VSDLVKRLNELVDARDFAERERRDTLNKMKTPDGVTPVFDKLCYMADLAFFEWLNWHGEKKDEPDGRSKMRALTTRIAALEVALKPFADLGAKLNSRKLSDETPMDGCFTVYAPAGWPELTLNSDHLRRANEAWESA